jgi:hypothetical protein
VLKPGEETPNIAEGGPPGQIPGGGLRDGLKGGRSWWKTGGAKLNGEGDLRNKYPVRRGRGIRDGGVEASGHVSFRERL